LRVAIILPPRPARAGPARGSRPTRPWPAAAARPARNTTRYSPCRLTTTSGVTPRFGNHCTLRPGVVPPIPLQVKEKPHADWVAENAGLRRSAAASPVSCRCSSG